MTTLTTKAQSWDFEDGIEYCSKGFSGKLQVRSNQGQEWNFHFFMGRLTGESGGINPLRRWKSLLFGINSGGDQLGGYPIELAEFKHNASGCLERMVKQAQCTREQAMVLAKASLLDSLFDVLQAEYQSRQSPQIKLSFEAIPETDNQRTTLPWIFFRPKETLQEALTEFFGWRQHNLVNYSPNAALSVKGLMPLSIDSMAKELLAWVNNDRTIRDLAICCNINALAVAQTLHPLVEKGLVSFRSVEDIFLNSAPIVEPINISTPKVQRPLVAYVDDNPLEGQIMGTVLEKLGCDYTHVRDPLKTLPTLLKQKPDLIFLDLVMPIVNGYEVCAQLRRIAVFSETPIVILTSNDGIIDRVRAKVVGSSDFLAKPIEKEKVFALLQKFNIFNQPSVLEMKTYSRDYALAGAPRALGY